ncbi:MAG: translation initiation factor IF-2 [Planctomycetota bacterium]|jgi:translation initiation factor IF-2
MATTRVYILAKELGVKSAAIVKKCQDEGLDVKNHMAVISAGLAATVREWFSEGENITTVETAKKVDLKRVKIKKKVKKKPAKKKEVKKVRKRKTKKAADTEDTGAGEGRREGAAAIAEAPPEEAPPPEELPVVEAPAEEAPEEEPEPILPAGPMLEKPAPAQLSGPQVVRVEAPEPLRPPKARVRYDAPVTEPLIYRGEDQERLTVAVGPDAKPPPKRHKERTHGRRREDQETEAPKKSRSGKWRQRDIEERRARLDAAGGEGLRLRPTRRILTKAKADATVAVRPDKAVVSEPITVRNLSAALAVKSADIMSKLVEQGVMATANQAISNDIAELISLEFGTELRVERKSRLEEEIQTEFEHRERKSLKRRPVVATMLGHVDHGKTSLLDKIRSTAVTATEAGGITQHIGAYQVTRSTSKVTFLDTPGHEAFTAMRARGANMTDVAVLVVAADDGVMPQTIEAIAHSKAANVSIIVALNKIDLPGCDINRIYSQLAEHDLTPTEWGGDTEVVKTSAVTGEGIDDLLEHLDYVAELLELKADESVPATGWVVEAKMSPQKGPVATLLIKEGRLSKGSVILANSAYGRVKTLRNSYGKSIKTAASSTPVEVTGLSDVPQAGDRFYCLDDINRAKAAAEENQIRSREISLAQRTQVTLENLFSQIEAGNVKELNLIIRADVQGSVDVLTKYLSDLSTDEVKIRILHAAPGGITEGDVVLAEASNAIIIGFNVVADDRVARIAETKAVDIRLYNVIYRITEDLQKSMVGLLEPQEQEKTLGRAVVRQTFKISRIGTIGGCYVNSGVVTKNARLRLIRDNIVIRDNLSIESLKHFKDDVREVKAGLECGIKIAKFDDVKVDDVFDFYEIVKVDRTL